ncbi:MAG TPA: RIP metalloprotease RseP [Bryobacteraceae bacterium]|nr:RIP metalloprotease RseP [Bryobacteraceae bacterium]
MGFFHDAFWFAVLLGVMILVHELGHFWAAVSVGIKVETFSIGFGSRLFGFKRGETDFRVSAIPLGGYVRMLGEQPGDDKAADPRAFQAKKRWQRAIVIIAGPLMNVVLAIAIVAGLYMHGVQTEVEQSKAVVSSITPGSPAAQAGLQPGDKIIDFAGQANPSWPDVVMKTAMNANRSLPIVVDRHGQKLHLSVTPRMDPKEGLGSAGWNGGVQVAEIVKGMPAAKAGLHPGDSFIKVNGQAISSPDTVRDAIMKSGGKPVDFVIARAGEFQNVSVIPQRSSDPKTPYQIGIYFQRRPEFVKLGIGAALAQSLTFNKQNALLIYQLLGGIIEHRVSPKSALAGPIQIAQMSSEAAHEGATSYLTIMALISLNLAVFNLLPIPILDGGTLLLLIIEMLLQREVSVQVKETVFKIGFVCLMAIVVFAIYNDISRILTKS